MPTLPWRQPQAAVRHEYRCPAVEQGRSYRARTSRQVWHATVTRLRREERGLRRPNGVAVRAEHVNLPAATDDERISESFELR